MDFSINSLCVFFKEGPQQLALLFNDGSNVSLFEDRSEDQSVALAEWIAHDQLLFQRYSTVQAAVRVTVLGMHDASECRFLQSTLQSKHSRT